MALAPSAVVPFVFFVLSIIVLPFLVAARLCCQVRLTFAGRRVVAAALIAARRLSVGGGPCPSDCHASHARAEMLLQGQTCAQ